MPADTPIPQAGAIPIWEGRVGLVTSQNTGAWIFPKGKIDAGMTVAEAALQEAWEEAGVRGTLQPEPVGTYRYVKFGRTHEVTAFVLEVAEVCAAWPEQDRRRRCWSGLDEALALIEYANVRELVRRAFARAAPESGEEE